MAKGAGTPEGRTFHVAAPNATGWFVVDVWESRGHLDRFGKTLIPVLMAAGVTPAQPEIRPVHNIMT